MVNHLLRQQKRASDKERIQFLYLLKSKQASSKPMVGIITQVSISDGGVPKLAIPEAVVTLEGLVGDRQRDLKYHGGLNRAVCLWAQEVIDQLRQEGHDIAAGSAGENVTLQGLDWALLIPGVQLQLGDQVQVEITDYAPPCRTIMHCFSNRKYGRINQKHYPGQSRLYAKVLTPGSLKPGDRADYVSQSQTAF